MLEVLKVRVLTVLEARVLKVRALKAHSSLVTRYSLLVTSVSIVLAACAAGPPEPARLDTANEACRHCRMSVSDRHFAAQIVSVGEEPLFFDDLGCLRDYIRDHGGLSPGAVAFVADHRTTEWVEARLAVYTRQPGLTTPMASGLAAHRDAASLEKDDTIRGGEAVPVNQILEVRRQGPPSRPPRE